jgi:hypothetical protein
MRRALLVGLGLLACSGAPAAPSAATSAASPAGAAARPRTPLPDTPLMQHIRKILTDCKIDDDGDIRDCEHTYFDDLGALEWDDLPAALALECRLLGEPEPRLARLGLARIEWILTGLKRGGRLPDVADAAFVDCLRDHLAAPGPLDLRGLVRAYVQFAVGLGRDDEVLTYLRGHADPDVLRDGYASLWKFAGMRMWPTIQRVAREADPEIAASALASLDGELTEDEQTTVCTAFAGWLRDPRAPVHDVAAAHVAYNCLRYHPDLLADVRARLAAGTLAERQLLLVEHLAKECVEVGPETCEEAAALLLSIARSATAPPNLREFSLLSVWRRDNAGGLALARSLRGDPGLASAAASLLDRR